MRLNLMKLLKAGPKMDLTFTEHFFLEIFRVLIPLRKEKRVGKTVRQPIANSSTTEESSIQFSLVERKIGQGDCRMRSTIHNLVTIMKDEHGQIIKKAKRFTELNQNVELFIVKYCVCSANASIVQQKKLLSIYGRLFLLHLI